MEWLSDGHRIGGLVEYELGERRFTTRQTGLMAADHLGRAQRYEEEDDEMNGG